MKYIIDYKSWILQYLFKLLDIIHDNFKDCVNSILLNMQHCSKYRNSACSFFQKGNNKALIWLRNLSSLECSVCVFFTKLDFSEH